MSRQGASSGRYFERMGEPGPDLPAFPYRQQLRLARQAAKRAGMQQPVSIALEGTAPGQPPPLILGRMPAGREVRIGGPPRPSFWLRERSRVDVGHGPDCRLFDARPLQNPPFRAETSE